MKNYDELRKKIKFTDSRANLAMNVAEITGRIPEIAGPILCYISKEGFSVKPNGAQIKTQKYRHSFIKKSNSNELKNKWNIEEVKYYVETGHSIQNGEFRNPSAEAGEPSYTFRGAQFKQSNMIIVDIDDGNPTIENLLKWSAPFKPALIYETLSHTPEKKKYRMLYLLNETIETTDYKAITQYFINKIPGADQACKDSGRMYFGGKSVPFFEGNFIFVDELLEIPEVKENKATIESGTTGKMKTQKTGKEIKESLSLTDIEIAERLKKIGQTIKIEEVEKMAAYDFINYLPMDEILGVNSGDTFRCIMPNHQDNHPSSSIIEIGEKQMYKCFGCKDPIAKNLIDVIQKATGKTLEQTMDFMLKNLGVKYDTTYRTNSLKTIQQNRITLTQNQDTPIYKKLRNSRLLGMYIALTNFMENYLPESPVETSGEISMFASVKHLSKTFNDWDLRGTDFSSISKKMRDLTSYGLIEKVDYVDLSPSLREKTGMLKIKAGKKYGVTYWRLPELTEEILKKAWEKIEEEKSLGYTKRHLNRTQMVRTHGAEETHKVYNQDEVLKYSAHVDGYLMSLAQSFLNRQGYFTRQELIDHSKYNERKVYQYLPGIAKEMGLISKRINKVIKLKFGIDMPMGSMVYVPVNFEEMEGNFDSEKATIKDDDSYDYASACDEDFMDEYDSIFALTNHNNKFVCRTTVVNDADIDFSDIPF